MRGDSTVSVERKSRLIVEAIEAKKGIDIVQIDIGAQSDIADRFIIATAGSTAHMGALLDAIEDQLRAMGEKDYHIEGRAAGRWALIDARDILVHIFDEGARRRYDIEKLWGGDFAEVIQIDPVIGAR